MSGTKDITDSDNGFSAVRYQAIILTNDDLLVIIPMAANVIEIWIKIQQFSYNEIDLEMSPAK